MNVARLAVVAALLAGTCVAAISACSSSPKGGAAPRDAGHDTGSTTGKDSGTSGSGSGSSSDSGGGFGSDAGSESGAESGVGFDSSNCSIIPGTYEMTNTYVSGDGGVIVCPPPYSTVTYPQQDSGSSDLPDTGITCTTSSNGPCNTTTTCSGTSAGTMITTSASQTVMNGIPSGTNSDTYSGTGFYSSCTYSYVLVPLDSGAQDSGTE